MSNFKIGQKVICVSSFPNNPPIIEQLILPIVEKIYTIREIKEKNGKIGLLLEEIINKPIKHINGFGEQFFGIKGFRPLQYDSATS